MVAAIVALAVLLVIAAAMLALGAGAQLSGKRLARQRTLDALADAGIEYGYWERAYQAVPLLPFTVSRSFGPGSFTMTISDNGASSPKTIRIVSTGRMGNDSRTVARVFTDPRAYSSMFDYALFSFATLSDGNRSITTGGSSGNGDIRSNNSISMAKSTVNGNATAVGSIGKFQKITGKSWSGAPAIATPTIDASFVGPYYQNANRRLWGDQNWFGFTFLVPNEIVWVFGNVTMNAGAIVGSGTIVCVGQYKAAGDLTYLDPANKLAVLAAGSFANTTSCNIVGFYYADNPQNTAVASISRNLTINPGCLAADSFTFKQGPHRFIHDSDMNPTLGAQLHLPGFWP